MAAALAINSDRPDRPDGRPVLTIRDPFYQSFCFKVTESSRIAFAMTAACGVSLTVMSVVATIFALLASVRHCFSVEYYQKMAQSGVDGILQGCMVAVFGVIGVFSPTAIDAFIEGV